MAIPGIQRLHRLLRMRGVAGRWHVGKWLTKHFGKGNAASPANMEKLALALKKIPNCVPISENHFYKCRQFCILFRKREQLKPILKSCLPWRRVIRLLGIKKLAKDRPHEMRELRRLIDAFPGSASTGLSAWIKSVDDLRARCRKKNPAVKKMKLLIACRINALYRLDWATAAFKRMNEFVPKKERQPYLALKEKLKALIFNFEECYPDIRDKMRKPKDPKKKAKSKEFNSRQKSSNKNVFTAY